STLRQVPCDPFHHRVHELRPALAGRQRFFRLRATSGGIVPVPALRSLHALLPGAGRPGRRGQARASLGSHASPGSAVGWHHTFAPTKGHELARGLSILQATKTRTTRRLPTRTIRPFASSACKFGSVTFSRSGPRVTPPCWIRRRASLLLFASSKSTR